MNRGSADATVAFRKRVAYWSARLKVRPARVALTRLKNKWASCSRAGRITFARDIVSLPLRVRDYVIVHELLHLRVANHGRLYKAHMTTTLPDWQRRHRALGRYSEGPRSGHG
jgi:hypothetical protein